MKSPHTELKDKLIVFYDGDCAFCHSWLQKILKNDANDLFRFASLQGNLGQKFLYDRGLNRSDFDTMYLWKPDHYYLIKSEAALEILRNSTHKLRFLANIDFLPKIFLDFLYDQVARRRMKFSSQCELPSENDRKKFLD